MQNEEPRAKRTAAGIESRNVLCICIYIYVYVYIGSCYEFEYRLSRCFSSRERMDFTSFLAAPEIRNRRCPRRTIGNGCFPAG